MYLLYSLGLLFLSFFHCANKHIFVKEARVTVGLEPHMSRSAALKWRQFDCSLAK